MLGTAVSLRCIHEKIILSEYRSQHRSLLTRKHGSPIRRENPWKNYVIDEWEMFPIWIIKKRNWFVNDEMLRHKCRPSFFGVEFPAQSIVMGVQHILFLEWRRQNLNMIAKNQEALTSRSVNYNDKNKFIILFAVEYDIKLIPDAEMWSFFHTRKHRPQQGHEAFP